MDPRFLDSAVRAAAFAWLGEQVRLRGEDVLPRALLLEGFRFRGERVPLVSAAQGIFKPRVLPEAPLSILTTVSGPYEDRFTEDGLAVYRYRGSDPHHRDNVGLRIAMERRLPMVYFHGEVRGRYQAFWPVYIVGDDPGDLHFLVELRKALDPRLDLEESTGTVGEGSEHIQRAYSTTQIRRRLHQGGFRERVLRAYRERCALCRLGHRPLLDAAHIIPDRDPQGRPEVPNGLSMCKIHHAAFDSDILGIRPDGVVEVRSDVLREEDGPMLMHGLQEMHGGRIALPRARRDRPDPARLEERYARFRAAS